MKKNFIAMVVYNRYHNLQRWLHCWNLCNHHDFELVIIHNIDEEHPEYRELCDYYGIKYIQRPNIGYDTAPFQDIVLERLEGFDNDWDKLMWITDDWFPMDRNFIKHYVNHYQDGVVGIVCTEISNQVKTHIRTSGFLISKEVSKKLTFDTLHISSKTDCYNFEHLSPNAFYEQVLNMGLRVELVSPLDVAPLWDSEHRANLNRMDEHNTIFYSSKKVAIICPIYKSYPQIVSSMITQTYQDWELYLIQDGNEDKFIGEYVKLVNDPRIKYVETEQRVGDYGHPIRQEYLKKLVKSDADFVLITNGDNYHTPNCLENMVNGFDGNTIATYCDSMVHSYTGWNIINCRLECGHIDCASIMIRKDIACKIGWNDTVSHSSDWTYFQEIANVHGWDKFKKVNGCLLIHN
jgi:hypothetical protein